MIDVRLGVDPHGRGRPRPIWPDLEIAGPPDTRRRAAPCGRHGVTWSWRARPAGVRGELWRVWARRVWRWLKRGGCDGGRLQRRPT